MIAPSFEFDVDRINFGQVSFNFDYQKLIKVKNISRVPFVFKLRVPGDDTGLVQEFKLEPNIRQIEPQETAMVNLTFTPAQAIQYDTSLVLDIDHVGENMASIPIKAECIVPNVKIEPSNSLD